MFHLSPVYSQRMSSNPATRIFIDFEGNKDRFPTFLGVLECDQKGENFIQYVLEPCFHAIAPSSKHPTLISSTLTEVLEDLSERFDEQTPIYAWSTHEQQVISAHVTGSTLEIEWGERISDAKKEAKRWARRIHPHHEFKKMEGRGKNTLDQYLDLIGYKVPLVHGAGKTGQRITSMRTMLETGRQFEDWPPGLKGHLTKLLAHNYHDCYGLKALLEQVDLSK